METKIILCAISGGSSEKLTRAVTFPRDLLFEISGFLGGVPGFLGGDPGFWGVPESSVMFRDVPGCSGVLVFRFPVFLEVLNA